MTSPGIIGELDVADDIGMVADELDGVFVHHQHVVNVVLQKQIGMIEFIPDRQHLLAAANQKVRHVHGVDRFENGFHA